MAEKRDCYYYSTSRSLETTTYRLSFSKAPLHPDPAPNSSLESAINRRLVFAKGLLNDALNAPVVTGSDPGDQLIQTLRQAIAAHDASAVRALWKKIERHSTVDMTEHKHPNLVPDKWNKPISEATLYFLIFHVQEPKLVTLLLHQMSPPGHSWASRWRYPWRNDVTPIVAAVMDALMTPNAQNANDEDDRANTKKWLELLDILYVGLPERPMPLWVHGGSGSPACMSILEHAVVCAWRTTKPVHQVLVQCKFSSAAYSNAFTKALRPGTLKAHTTVPVLTAIYAGMLEPVRSVYASNRIVAMKEAWTQVVEASTSWREVVVCSSESGIVQIPFASSGEDDRPPGIFLEVIDAMVSEHARYGGEHLEMLLAYAIENAVCTLKTHLVEKLLQLWDDFEFGHACDEGKSPFQAKGDDGVAQSVPEFMFEILTKHPRLYALVQKRLTTPQCAGVWIKHALHRMLAKSEHDAVRLLVDSLPALPPEVNWGCTLPYYVKNMCSDLCSSAAMAVRREYAHMVKRDFEAFLAKGSFETDVLAEAMDTARQYQCTVAVEVLVSPGHKVPLPEGDPFVDHILAHVFAPGAPLVREAGERFEKRQKCE